MNSLKLFGGSLVQSLKPRGRNALEYLYTKYSGGAHIVVLVIITDKEMENDILQDVFIKIWWILKTI